jgi:TonB family protein
MKSIVVVGVVVGLGLGACASSTAMFDREAPAPRTGVQLSLIPSADATQVIPEALDPRLPRVDRMATQVRYELGESITAELSLCVNPDGNVTEVALARSTGMSALDTAIIDDVRGWQFAELPGTPTLRTCQRAALAYRVR